MADNTNNLSGRVGLDTTAFKTGVSELTTQMKSIETSFRASAAVMGNWSSTSSGLKDRISSLTDKLNLQKQALSVLHSEYNKAVSEQGASSKSAASLANQMFDMEKKISSTESSLKKYNSQLQTVEKQEKENNSSLSRLKSAFSSLSEQSQKSTSSISNHFGNLKGIISGAVTSIVAGLSVKSIIDATDSAEKTMAQMDAVLKSTGGAAGMTKDQLNQLASAQAKVTTYSAGTTKQAENMLLTFTNIKSSVFPETIQATEDMATAMHMDATDAAKTLGKALNDPVQGLSKLTRQGVTFTDAQKKQIKAMQAAGDTAGAQKVILQELEKEFGGSAKAAGTTFTGQIQIMTNNLKSAGVTIMTSLMPIITNLMPSIVKGAQDIASEIVSHKDDIQAAVSKVADIVKDIFNFVEGHGDLVKNAVLGIAGGFALWKTTSGLINGITSAMKILNTITGIFSATEAAQAVATDTATASQLGLNAAMLANPVGIIVAAVVAAIAAVTAGCVLLYQNWDTLKKKFDDLSPAAKTIVGILGAIVIAANPIAGLCVGIVAAIKGVQYAMSSSIETQKFGDNISQSTQKALNSFNDLNKKADEDLKDLAWSGEAVTKDMANEISGNINQMAQQTVEGFNKQREDSLKQIQQLASGASGITKDQMKTMVTDINKGYDTRIKSD